MRLRLLALATAAVLIAGCNNHFAPPVAIMDTHIHCALAVPTEPRHLVNIPFALTLTDSLSGKPINKASVDLDLSMPSMSMPPNTVTLHETRPGVYTGTGIFTMPGHWLVTASIMTTDHHVAQHEFPVTVR